VLTLRECAILMQVAEGRVDKQIVDEMGITETTVKASHPNTEVQSRIVRGLCFIVQNLKLLPENSAPS
jgi:FixJ family two-component response regulator